MNKLSLLSIVVSVSLLTACGGGSNSGSSSSSSSGSPSGSSTGSSSSGSTSSSSTGGSSSGTGSSTGGSSSGSSSSSSSSSSGSGSSGSSTGGSSSGGTGGTPTTSVLYNRTIDYQVLNQTATVTIKVTEFHQNDDTATTYNLWDYSYSPTKENYQIFFDSYLKTVSPANVVTDEVFQQNGVLHTIEPDPRPTTVDPLREHKTTKINFDPIGNQSLSAITYGSLDTLEFNNANPPELIGVKIRREEEDLITNQDLCSDDIVSKGDILIDALGQGFWQIGDKITIEIDSNTFIVGCDSQNNPEILGPAHTKTIAVDTLTHHISQLIFRNTQFNNVLEFTNTDNTTNGVAGPIVTTSSGNTYLQFHTGEVASSYKSCLGGDINDPAALCFTTDEVANNVPTIPEL